MPLFEVVVLKVPTEAEAEQGMLEEILLPRTELIAKDQQAASFNVLMSPAFQQVRNQPGFDPSKMEVRVRPF